MGETTTVIKLLATHCRWAPIRTLKYKNKLGAWVITPSPGGERAGLLLAAARRGMIVVFFGAGISSGSKTYA